MTRLAASPYEVWAGILQTNRGAIDDALGAFINEMEALRAALQSDGAATHFERGQALRASLERN